jgi:ergothioneine biosynthesis protein EgtB
MSDDELGRLPDLTERFRAVRKATCDLAAPLSDADATVQSMPAASPAKWHLAHTSWFFEVLALLPALPDYSVFDPGYTYLFNSYYESIGAQYPRGRRGLLTRPTLEEILAYRAHVDDAVELLLLGPLTRDVEKAIELGCHHEQQHQELLLADILHLFAQNPLRPVYRSRAREDASTATAEPLAFKTFEGGIIEIGAGEGFAYDCERPRHRIFIDSFRLANRPVVNAEWMDFIEDGGYRNPLLWLSDGWEKCRAEKWEAPLYWERRDNDYWTMTLSGLRPVNRSEPVVHISYFEADAFARWAKRRLPTEAEWERAASGVPVSGNFVEQGRMHPTCAPASATGLHQLFGDVWEWTGSAFSSYPRFRPSAGPASEYNGKFMCGQLVLRGGSCATPTSHMRASYRNFFPPDARWQFSGLRLAGDADDA